MKLLHISRKWKLITIFTLVILSLACLASVVVVVVILKNNVHSLGQALNQIASSYSADATSSSSVISSSESSHSSENSNSSTSSSSSAANLNYTDINNYVFVGALSFGRAQVDTSGGRTTDQRILKFGSLSVDYAAVGSTLLLGDTFNLQNKNNDDFQCAQWITSTGQSDAAVSAYKTSVHEVACLWYIKNDWLATVRLTYDPQKQTYSQAKAQLATFISNIELTPID